MSNLIVGIGQCGANIINDTPDDAKSPDWQIIFLDGQDINLKPITSHYDNIYIFCGLGGIMAFQYATEIMSKCRMLTTNLLCFCTLPFKVEGDLRYKRAEETLNQISKIADITIVQPNDNLSPDDNISLMNKPIVATTIASIEQSHKPLFYTLSAIIDSSDTNTWLRNFISSDHINIYVNDTRLKNLVSEALNSNGSISTPDGVRNKMQEIWADYKSGKPILNNIFEVELPTVGNDKE